MSANTSDDRLRESRDQCWDETIRAACRMLDEGSGRVKSIHLVGEAWDDVGHGRLKRFTEVAQAAATDFGIAVTVGYDHGHPCLHLARRPRTVTVVTRDAR